MGKIMPYLQEISKQLGVAVEHVWGVLIKQSFMNGVTDLVMAGLYLIFMVVLIVFVPRLYKVITIKHQETKEDRIKNGTGFNGSHNISSYKEDGVSAMRYATIIVSTVLCLVFFFNILHGIPLGIKEIYNPEYYALQNILSMIGK